MQAPGGPGVIADGYGIEVTSFDGYVEAARRQGDVDVVIELLGGGSVIASLDAPAVRGRMVVVGFRAERTLELELATRRASSR